MKMQKKKKIKPKPNIKKRLGIRKLEHLDGKNLSTYHIVRKFTLDEWL